MANPYFQRYFLPGYEPTPVRTNAPSHGWYTIGCDIGINNDHTVLVVMDTNVRKQVFYWRFVPGSSRNWHKNYDAMEWVAKYFKFPLRVDCGGTGSTIPSEMPRRGVGLEEWGGGEDHMKFNEYNKPIIMDNLASLIGGRHIQLFNIPEIKDELRKVQRKAKASGRGFDIRAPKGDKEHDDIAMALGLACMDIRPRLNVIGGEATMVTGVKSVWQTEEW